MNGRRRRHVHRSSFISHHSQIISTARRRRWTVAVADKFNHRSPFTVLSFTVHRSPFTVHRSPLIVDRSSFIVHRSSFIVHRSSLIPHPPSLIPISHH